MINKGVLIIFLIFGIILVIIELVRVDTQCARQKVIYRYLPRTFEEQQDSPVPVSSIFRTMFEQESPWIRNMGAYDYAKREQVNNFFISQS